MVRADPILIDDETDPVVQALEGRAIRLAVVPDDGPIVVLGDEAGTTGLVDHLLHLLRLAMYVTITHAAAMIGTSPVVVLRLVRSGALAATIHDDRTYVSLQSVLDYRDRQDARRDEGLTEMVRVSEAGGLYNAELDSP
jgi:hypothetical protein